MIIQVTPEDASARSLPAIGFRVDTGVSPLAGRPFAHPRSYLVASGPPGAGLMFCVYPTEESDQTSNAVERAVQPGFATPGLQPFAIVDRTQITISGASRPAIVFTAGRGFASMTWCATVITAPAGSLLVAFGIGPRGPVPLTCQDIVSHPFLSTLVSTFTLLPGA